MTEIEPLAPPRPSAEEAASELARRTGALTHDVAVVLGSGWGPAADAFGPPVAEIPFSDLPGFTPPGVPAPTVSTGPTDEPSTPRLSGRESSAM